MTSNNEIKRKMLLISLILILIVISSIFFTLLTSKVLNSMNSVSTESTEVKTVKVIQVGKDQKLFGTSFAYIVKNPEGSGRIAVSEPDDYARYQPGDEIQVEITKQKGFETVIELKN